MKTMKINIPKGYEIDKEKSTFEEIVFKKIDTKPRSWEAFCKDYITRNGFYISTYSKIESILSNNRVIMDATRNKNLLPTKEYAEAMLALCQLISLRQAWIGDWKPDYNKDSSKYSIVFYDENIKVFEFAFARHPLSFSTEEMANEFVACFKDLIEKAKILL